MAVMSNNYLLIELYNNTFSFDLDGKLDNMDSSFSGTASAVQHERWRRL